MKTCYCARFVLAGLALSISAGLASASVNFLVTNGTTLYRADDSGGSITSHTLSDSITGMTIVPEGVSMPGLSPGDVLAISALPEPNGPFGWYRLDNAFSGTPSLSLLGTSDTPNFSPVFVNGRLFGVFSGTPSTGNIRLHEYDLNTFESIAVSDSGLGSPQFTGGMVYDYAADQFVFTNHTQNRLFRHTFGSGFSTALPNGAGVDFQNNAMEAFGGTWYGSLVDVNTNRVLIGAYDSSGVFSTIVDVSENNGGSMGFVAIPSPGAAALFAAAGLISSARRRR